jgi:hypothetical protein
VRYRETVVLGETHLSPTEVGVVVEDLGRTTFRGCDYSLLQRNCNHLTAVLAERLTGRPAPAWPNRLADVAVALHCLLPASLVPPLATPSGPGPFASPPGVSGGASLGHGEATALLLRSPSHGTPAAVVMHRGR